MTRRADRFRVTVVPPRTELGEGPDWYGRIRPPHGKKGETRRSSRTTDLAAAEAWARRVEDRLNAGVVAPAGDPSTLEVYDRFYAARELAGKTSESTLKALRLARGWLVEALAVVPSSKLTAGDVLARRDAIEGQLAASTVNLHVSALRRCWSWARARTTMFPKLQPFPAIEDLAEPPSPKRPLYPEEVAAVLLELAAFRGGKWLALFRCLAESGHRVGALLAARGRDLHAHPERPWIDVVDAKTRKQRRALILPETAALLPRRRPEDLIFQGRAGPIAVPTVNAVFHRALQLAGIDHLKGLVDVHSFRRFVVDQNCQDGESIARGMRITGHSSPDVFLRYQANSRDNPHDSVRRSMERVEAAAPTPGATPSTAANPCHPSALAATADNQAPRPEAVPPQALECSPTERPPRVPPRVTAVPAGSRTVLVGRSQDARTIACILIGQPVSPEAARRAFIAQAFSYGLQRGTQDAAAELDLLTPAQEKARKRAAALRAQREERRRHAR